MYGKDYFAWQADYGDFGSIIDQDKFLDYLSSKKRVLEFGCGGGYLLAKLPAKEKIGIEINPIARKQAQRNGVTVVFVTPHERNTHYHPGDINQHLFTWSELNLANLFSLAGYKIVAVETRKTAWPPFYRQLYAILGKSIFSKLAGIYGRLFAPMWEGRLVAKK